MDDDYGYQCDVCDGEMEYTFAHCGDGYRRKRWICPACGYEWLEALNGGDQLDDLYNEFDEWWADLEG